jgi:hypothetical protein
MLISEFLKYSGKDNTGRNPQKCLHVTPCQLADKVFFIAKVLMKIIISGGFINE